MFHDKMTQDELLNHFRQLNFLRLATGSVINERLKQDISERMYLTRRNYVAQVVSHFDVMVMDDTFRTSAHQVCKFQHDNPDAFQHLLETAQAYPEPSQADALTP